MKSTVALVAGSIGFANVAPAATWLPVVRRFLPALESAMSPGRVAVTFDDGPHPLGTPAILDSLDDLGWRATFFMLGSEVLRFPELAREVSDRGHEIGVHGFAHRYLIARTPRQAWSDLKRGRDVVAEATGTAPRWWRPPYGVMSTAALGAAARLELRPILWSAWGKDWRSDATPESIAEAVERGRLRAGTILLHDSDALSAPGSWRRTNASLPLIAQRLDTLGLTVAALA